MRYWRLECGQQGTQAFPLSRIRERCLLTPTRRAAGSLRKNFLDAEMFYREKHTCCLEGTWQGWKILPAANVGGGWAGLFNINSSSSNPAAVSNATGQVSPLAVIYNQPGLDLFAVSKDGHLIHTD